MGMKWSPAAAVLAVLVVSGCGGGSTASTAGLVRTHGMLVRVGGPAPGGPVAMPGIRLRFQAPGASADVRTDRHGRFAFDVAPGTYTVSVLGSGLAPITVPHTIRVPHSGRV